MYPGGNDECECGTECKQWKDKGSYCFRPCDRTGNCDKGLMCEDGICVSSDKYNLDKWDKTATNNQHLKQAYKHEFN